MIFGQRFKELHCLVDSHLQHIGYRPAFVSYFQCLSVVAFAVAHLTIDVDVWQEIHFYGSDACTLAGFAPASTHVERETTRLVASDFGTGQLSKQLTDLVEDADIGGGVAAWCPSDGRLVNLYDLVYIFHAADALVGQGAFLCPIEMAAEDGMKRLVDQCRFAAAADTCHTYEQAQGNVEGGMLQIVAGCTFQH